MVLISGAKKARSFAITDMRRSSSATYNMPWSSFSARRDNIIASEPSGSIDRVVLFLKFSIVYVSYAKIEENQNFYVEKKFLL